MGRVIGVLVMVIISALLVSCGNQVGHSSVEKTVRQTDQVIEHLSFNVKADRVEEFIELDQKIWTTRLAQFDGFISKEVWTDEYKPGEVILIICWDSFEAWKSIPEEVLNETMAKFDEAFGAEDYKLVQELHQEKRLHKVLEYR